MKAGKDGAWARGATNLKGFASRLRDYCLAGDWMCQGQWTPRTHRGRRDVVLDAPLA